VNSGACQCRLLKPPFLFLKPSLLQQHTTLYYHFHFHFHIQPHDYLHPSLTPFCNTSDHDHIPCLNLVDMDQPGKGKRARGDEEQTGNKRQQTGKPGTPVFQTDLEKLNYLQAALEACFQLSQR
jgi:hypothetical protein